MNSQEETKLSFPKVYPIAPEATKQMKYGNIPVNLAAGKIDYSVPIYTIKVGEFEYPISLSYNYSGLVVQEDVGLVGLGWSLNGLGLITRQINGNPDESMSFGYIGGNMDNPNGVGVNFVEPYYKQELSQGVLKQLFENSANGQWDTEPDKFMIKAFGAQGSFYLNAKAKPVFMPQKNYKIIFENNFLGKITVINDLGIIYEFDAIEHALNKYPTSVHNYISGWYLTKIKFPNTSKEISFVYDSYNYTKTSYTETKSTVQGSGCSQIVTNSWISNSNITVIRPKILRKIVFPEGSLDFSNKIDSNGAMLEKIELVNNQGDMVSQFNLEYSNSIPSARKTLQAITKSKGESILPYYSFEYYGTLPEVIDYRSQDYWGFYNGANNSGRLEGLIQGNREISFEDTRIGALKKIVYPTNGYTKINYEPNEVPFGTSNVYNGLGDYVPEFDGMMMIELDSDDSGTLNTLEKTITIPTDNHIFSVDLFAGCYGNYGMSESTVEISGAFSDYKSTNRRRLMVTMELGGVGSNVGSNEEARRVDDSFGLYSFITSSEKKITVSMNIIAANARARTYALIRYVKRKPPGAILFTTIGGIRIANTVDFNTPNDSIFKSYKYLKEDGTGSGSLSSQTYMRTTQQYEGCFNCNVYNVHAYSNLPFSNFQGNSVYYSRVEILNKGDEGNGKKVQYFSGGGGRGGANFIYKDTKDWRFNKYKEEGFANKNNVLVKVYNNKLKNTIEYPYPLNEALSNNTLAVGFRAQKKFLRYQFFAGCNPITTFSESDYSSETIYHRSEFYHKKEEEKTNYYEHGEIKNITLYDYKPYLGYLSKIKFIDSLRDTKSQHLIYPTDENNTTLINANILAKPTLVSNYTDSNNNQSIEASEKTLSHKTNYQVWNNKFVVPRIIQSAKNNNLLEDRLFYHKYDDLGNLLEIYNEKGIHTLFIWGYKNTLPIAKIDNASYDMMPESVLDKIDSIKEVSDKENSKNEEITLQGLLQELREDPYFSSSQVASSTYDPLIGVTSMADAKGVVQYYEYDEFNRLRYILDDREQILKKINYNYEGGVASMYNLSLNINSPLAIVPKKVITFSAITSSSISTSNLVYTWYIDDLQVSCGANSVFNKTFQTEGTHKITVSIYDRETDKSVSTSNVINVKYPNLNQPILNVTYNDVLKGSNIPLILSNIGGGSEDYRFEWYRNGIKLTSQENYTYTNSTQGRHEFFVKIIDNITGKSIQSAPVIVYSHPPLSSPIITISKKHIIKGSTVSFSASGISGGSGSRRYEWYINNTKQSATGTTFSYKFNTSGTYTIRFKAIDLRIPSHATFNTGTAMVYVYNSMYLSASPVSGNLNQSVRSITFNLSINGGSGTIDPVTWTIRQVNPSNVSTSNNTSTTLQFTSSTTGEYIISARVRDSKTGQIKSVSMSVIVTMPDDGGGAEHEW
ncbi:hypothetical protein ACE939_12015 [Aquimarina sp. W85]|uniref:hypothetical protein n=1 Tax=Aquimarina rhodophyticola TaxID=3342246 RepID=UPI00366F2C41